MSATSIILFNDYLDKYEDLTDEEYGKLVRAIQRFERDGIEPDFSTDRLLRVIFKELKPIYLQNRESYELVKKKKRLGGLISRGILPKGSSLADLEKYEAEQEKAAEKNEVQESLKSLEESSKVLPKNPRVSSDNCKLITDNCELITDISKNNLVGDGVLLFKGDRATPPTSELDQIKTEWNAIGHCKPINDFVPGTRRWDETQICIHMFGFEKVLEAIRRIRESEYLKARGSAAYDNYINRDTLQKVLEGNYDELYKSAEQAPESDYERSMRILREGMT